MDVYPALRGYDNIFLLAVGGADVRLRDLHPAMLIHMGLFSRKPLVCPVCDHEVTTGPGDTAGIGHFATHLNDTQGPGSPLRFGCGCPDAVFDVSGDFTTQLMRHLRDKHRLKITVM